MSKRRLRQNRKAEALYVPREPMQWKMLMQHTAYIVCKNHGLPGPEAKGWWTMTKNEKMFVGVLASQIENLGEKKEGDKNERD